MNIIAGRHSIQYSSDSYITYHITTSTCLSQHKTIPILPATYLTPYDFNMAQPTQNQSTGNTIPIIFSNGPSETVLITAVKANNLAQVEALIRQGADVNTPDIYGWTPLHHAARRVNESIAIFLLLSGADIEARNGFYQTPLIVAATRVNGFEMVQYLLECGANIEARDDQGNTINHYLTREEMVSCRNP